LNTEKMFGTGFISQSKTCETESGTSNTKFVMQYA